MNLKNIISIFLFSLIILIVSCSSTPEVDLNGEWEKYDSNYYSIDVPKNTLTEGGDTADTLIEGTYFFLGENFAIDISVFDVSTSIEYYTTLSTSEKEEDQNYWGSIVAVSNNLPKEDTQTFIEALVTGEYFSTFGKTLSKENEENVLSVNETKIDGRFALEAEILFEGKTSKYIMDVVVKGDKVYVITSKFPVEREDEFTSATRRIVSSIKLK